MKATAPHQYYQDRYADRPLGDAAREPTFRERVERALGAIGAPPRRILDFGCNTGEASEAFAAAGHRVVGIDVSRSAVALAAARVRNASFLRVESESSLPFADSSFDACFCSEVIEHLFDVPGFLAEIARVLAPGGVLVLTTPYHGWLKNVLVVSFNFDRHFDPTGGHIRFFSAASLARCLAVAGFRVDALQGVGRVWPFWKSMLVVARIDRRAS